MGLKKFIATVKESLGIDVEKSTKKKKALKILIKKLAAKKNEIKKTLKKKLDNNEKKDLTEEYEIICIQLKKGTKLLQKLNKESKKDENGR